MKVIEKVARQLVWNAYMRNHDAMGTHKHGSGSANLVGAYVDNHWEEFVEEAKRVLTAANILILPHDAEPMVGDVMERKVTKWIKMPYEAEWDDGVPASICTSEMADAFWQEFEHQQNHHGFYESFTAALGVLYDEYQLEEKASEL